MRIPHEALVIAAKYPEKGRVKTRLAVHIGEAAACELYTAFLLDLNLKFSGTVRKLFWAYTPGNDPFELFNSESSFPQTEGSLGERLLNIFKYMFSLGYKKVGIMGADVPHIPPDLVNKAFELLDNSDVVFIPADDGGYNLVALNTLHDLFTGIPMSVADVLKNTLIRAESLDLTVAMTPSLFDVDDITDLRTLKIWCRENPNDLKCTREVLDVLQ